MQLLSRRRRVLPTALVMAILSSASTWRTRALAAPEALPPAREQAARKFDEGEAAFAAGAYVRAAEAFEAAYKSEPHHFALWDAARAWQKAGELARAATLYARYLRVAPMDAADRAAAQTALNQLAPKLGRIEVTAPSHTVALIDDRPVEEGTTFVTPGTHAVALVGNGHSTTVSVTVAAGATERAVFPDPQRPEPSPAPPTPRPAPLEAPATRPPAPASPPPSTSSPSTSPTSSSRSKGWSPTVVYVGGGLTLAAAGFTLWSGLDTLAARREYDSTLSDDTLESGRGKQTRTNIAIGITAAFATLTTAAAIFLVEWSPKSSVTVSVSPTGASLVGSF